jgi:anti-sigma B factor antagonist
VPLTNVSTLDQEDVRPELDRLLTQVKESQTRNVIIDLARVSYFGTAMLEAMHAIWKCVREAGGKMALCNVSDLPREVLHVAGFDTLWPIYASRQEALEMVVQ